MCQRPDITSPGLLDLLSLFYPRLTSWNDRKSFPTVKFSLWSTNNMLESCLLDFQSTGLWAGSVYDLRFLCICSPQTLFSDSGTNTRHSPPKKKKLKGKVWWWRGGGLPNWMYKHLYNSFFLFFSFFSFYLSYLFFFLFFGGGRGKKTERTKIFWSEGLRGHEKLGG